MIRTITFLITYCIGMISCAVANNRVAMHNVLYGINRTSYWEDFSHSCIENTVHTYYEIAKISIAVFKIISL